jgi:hypothetical protein
MDRATDPRTRAVFYLSEAFIPFWLGNLGRQPSPEILERAETGARRGLEIAEELDDAGLMSAALDGLGGLISASGDHRRAVEIARRRCPSRID